MLSLSARHQRTRIEESRDWDDERAPAAIALLEKIEKILAEDTNAEEHRFVAGHHMRLKFQRSTGMALVYQCWRPRSPGAAVHHPIRARLLIAGGRSVRRAKRCRAGGPDD